MSDFDPAWYAQKPERAEPRIRDLMAEIERLREKLDRTMSVTSLTRRVAEAEARVRTLEEALGRLLRFEASYGEQDIPEEDREFARAALAGEEKP